MRKIYLCALSAPMIALTATPSIGAIPYTETVNCPGGETTTVQRTRSLSTFGRRIDGKPRTSWVAPFPLAVCDDGFILYQPLEEFEAEELSRAQAIVATPGYQATLAQGHSYLALYHLQREMEIAESDRLFTLMQATWQADAYRTGYERVLAVFAEDATAFLNRVGPEHGAFLPIGERVVNAYRVRGEFEEASTWLARLLEADTSDGATDARGFNADEYYAYFQRLIDDENREIDPPPPDEYGQEE